MKWINKISIIIWSLLWAVFAVAQSDNCNTATVITLTNGAACVNGTTTNSTSNNTMYGTCNTNPVNEVWYTYVSSGSQNDYTVTSNGITEIEIMIDIDGCNNTTFETCGTQIGTNTLTQGWGVPAGTQVWIMIASNGGLDGDFQLCINSYDPPPGNGNTCSGAIPLCDVTQTYNTPDIGILQSSGNIPPCFQSPPSQDIWYQFTVTQTGLLEWEAIPIGSWIELDWSMYDITSGCPGSLMACNYNYAGNTSASAGMITGVSCTTCPTFANPGPPCGEYCDPIVVTAGNTYAIQIDNYTGTPNTGLDFSFGPGMTAQIAPNTAFTISPSGITCGSNVTITINNTSLGVPDWDFGNGNTYSGTNPPAQTYTNPGVYAITAVIIGSCPSSHTEYVEIYGPLAASSTAINENCSSCDGSASVTANGGDGIYTYLWSNGATTPTITGLCVGSYTVTISNAICNTQVLETVVVNSGGALNFTSTNTNVLCAGANNGTASITPISGSSPYTYSWSNGQSTSTATGLAAGSYSVTITDAAGCETIQSFSINQPSMLLATGTTNAAKCGNNDGSATVNPSGGISPYTYLWDDPNAQSTQTADSLLAQTYNVTISDANSCNFILPVTIGFIDGPEIDTMISTALNCFGNSDGSASVSIINGTPPLVYTWDNGSTTSTITGLIAGSYTVTITDLYSCDTVGTITITEPTELLVNVMGTDTMCYGETGGVLNANASGGKPQYTYIWNNLATSSSIFVSPTNTTTYSVSITDSNNCQTQDSSSIFVSPALVASVTNEVICEGDNVLITVSASFGNGGPYNYLWNVGSTTSAITVSPLTNTNYQVTVTDGCSMPTNEALTVTVSPKPEALFSVACFPDLYVSQFTDESTIDTGNITSWFWDFDDGNISTEQHPVHDYSSATTYNVNLTVTSANGCTDVYNLLVQSPPTASFSPYPPETTTANPVIEFTDASSTNVTTWSWSFGDGDSTSAAIPGFSSGESLTHTYDSSGIFAITLMVTDINGCVDTTLEYVQIFDEYILFAPNTFSPNGNGINEKFIPVGVGFDKDNFEMLIYDRWGDLIFKTKDYSIPWDGKANDGRKEAQADVYVWMVNTTDPEKKKHQYIGHITLLK